MDLETNEQQTSKYGCFSIAIHTFLFLSIVYEGYLAFVGFPSLFDYQSFKITFWIQLIISIVFVEKRINYNDNSFFTLKNILITILTVGSLVLFESYEDKINQFKYYLPLAKIETVEVRGKVTEDNFITASTEDGKLEVKHSIHFEKYPKAYFRLARRKRLKNEINTLKNDTMFLRENDFITLRIRKSDYKRMLKGEVDSSIFFNDRYPLLRLEIFELESEGKIAFKSCGLK